MIIHPSWNEPTPGGWTVEDLDELPEDGRRRELIDGVLFSSAVRTSFHQALLMRLVHALDRACSIDYAATHGMEIRIGPRTALIADGLVVTSAAHDRWVSHFKPEDVLIAVEVVAPGSVTMDRITKPALYSQAGIPFYWRIETEGAVTIATHRLDHDVGAYVATGIHGDALRMEEPFAVEISISSLTRPRRIGRDQARAVATDSRPGAGSSA